MKILNRKTYCLLPQFSSVIVVPVLAVILHALISHALRLHNLPYYEGEEAKVEEDDEKDGKVVEDEDPAGVVVPAAEETPLLLAHLGVEDGVGGEADVKDGEHGSEQEWDAQTNGGRDS